MINIKANYSKRTFTIRKQDNKGKTYAKYRTLTLKADEFDWMDYWLESDWEDFLKTSQWYKAIK